MKKLFLTCTKKKTQNKVDDQIDRTMLSKDCHDPAKKLKINIEKLHDPKLLEFVFKEMISRCCVKEPSIFALSKSI